MPSETPRRHFALRNAADLAQRRANLIKKGRTQDDSGVEGRQMAFCKAAEGSAETFLAWFQGVAKSDESPPCAFRCVVHAIRPPSPRDSGHLVHAISATGRSEATQDFFLRL